MTNREHFLFQMTLLLLLSILVAITGCATVHQQCSDPKIAAQYRDYDQCYAERSADRERRRKAWSDAGDSFQQSMNNASRQPTQTNCTQIGNQLYCNSY